MTSDRSTRRPWSILVINPNTTQAMTDALIPLIEGLNFDPALTKFTFFTAPSGVPSINNEADAKESARHCLPTLITNHLANHDAFLICCYSAHPLVNSLREALISSSSNSTPQTSTKPVVGIFEASISTCLQASSERLGIVSTGEQWRGILDGAVVGLLGGKREEMESHVRYAGTETTGLNADELHSAPKAQVDGLMKEATKRVLRRGARAVCLGCAGMAGLDGVVRAACIEELGAEEGARVKIVDGVVSGVLYLEGALRAGW